MDRLPALCKVWNDSILCRFTLAAFLVFLGIGMTLGWVLGYTLEGFSLDGMTEDVAKTLTPRVARHLMLTDHSGPLTGDDLEYSDRFVHDSVLTSDTVSAKLWDREGRVVYSTDRSVIGHKFPKSPPLTRALGGTVVRSTEGCKDHGSDIERPYGQLLEVYAPVYLAGEGLPTGVFQVYRLYEPIHQDIQGRRYYQRQALSRGYAARSGHR